MIASLLRPASHSRNTADGVSDQSRYRGHLMEVVELCLPEQRRLGRRVAGDVVIVILFVSRPRQVHQPREKVGRRDPVGQRVVHLADQGEAVVGHPFGEVELPQRPVAIQGSAGDLADDLVELAPAPGTRDLHPAQVIVEVDVAVLQPHRVVQLPRDLDEPVAQRVEQVQATLDRSAEHLERELAVEVGGVDDPPPSSCACAGSASRCTAAWRPCR